MSAVRIIGEGYYGIVAEGVSVDQSVSARIDRAFEEATTIPSERLNIVPATSDPTRSTPAPTPRPRRAK